jgi:hypothetical protein
VELKNPPVLRLYVARDSFGMQVIEVYVFEGIVALYQCVNQMLRGGCYAMYKNMVIGTYVG